ncbi:aminoglycoside phosphotransferase family protein [Microlunatus sp. Gsoil 973]|uniref:aminoglycoside phosphotransferase family protein n=1 Tax=Microlunatus sp. Gsoil 973 TaxID=2672569 RepID=UPI0012B46459|nr:aminoglycoside phosphotransferase family protein [Microlunatus sp. Gsoil 973]QGN33829.1 phosphotransferase [Microlunatus sp. Gsoil 973]
MDERAIEWARGVLPDAAITPVRSRPWSEIAEVRAQGRLWWLKINKADTVYETRLLALLSDLADPLLPEVITHSGQPWSLIADAGRRLDDLELTGDQQLEIWRRALGPYAELQRRVDVSDLAAAGVPDFSPVRLTRWYDELLSGLQALPGDAPRISTEELTAIGALRPQIIELSAVLADGVPPALQHDDLHEGNLLTDAGLRRLKIIDWGDSVISHPFCTLRVTLGRLTRRVGRTFDDREIRRLVDIYLEPWRSAGWSQKTLLEQVDAAYRLAVLTRMYANIRGVGGLAAAVDPDERGDALVWVKEMITDAGGSARA